MARPDRVRIRARNPCLRERRRLFGWKVRFTTELPVNEGTGGPLGQEPFPQVGREGHR